MISSILRRRLMTKLSIMVVLTSSLTLGVLGLLEYNATRLRMEKALQQGAEMLAERLALGFVKIIWDYDHHLAESVILSEMKQPSITGILVWEEGGTQALFGAWRTSGGKIVKADAPIPDGDLVESGHVITRKKNPIGKVRVYITTRYLKESLRGQMWTMLMRVLLLDVVMVLLLIFLMRIFITDPMSTLRNAMAGMQEGELDQRVEVKSSDEIGQIADSFNRMAKQLKKRETQLVESEQKFSALVNQAADALFLHDVEGNFLDVNQKSCQSLGYSREELLRMSVRDVDINFSTEELVERFVEKLLPDTAVTIESELRKKDSTTFPVEVSLGLIQIQGEQVILALARDISERKVAEAALQKAHDELEIKVSERTAELSIAKDQAEAANTAKSDFLARMSHEIRTPLNAVTGLTQIVLKSELTDSQRDYLNKVRIASNNLMEVINDILDFSKVEAGRLELVNAPFDLDQVLGELSEMFSNRMAQKDIELVIDLPPQLPRKMIGDAGRLNQVLTNLVENAVKFTDSGEIVLRVGEGERDSVLKDHITLNFSVKDDGEGITPGLLPFLFDPFTQADSSLTRQHEGTGLGLAICRHLVELMGGRIWAESTPGRGSTFYFNVAMAYQADVESRFRLPVDFLGMKALVVDDSDTARHVLVDILESFRLKVSAVESGEKALQAIEQAADDPYRLVLMDWKTPGMDGIQTSRRIREMDLMSKSTAPIIIMVTAYGQKMIDAGIDATAVNTVLQKPARPSLLFNTIMEMFNRQAAKVTPSKAKSNLSRDLMDGRRVLVVEDSDLNRDVATALLKQIGLTVEIAENGKIAFDKVTLAGDHYYDLVLMDIQMPVMDGYESTRRIRAWEKSARASGKRETHTEIPIIALTAHALKGEKEKCLEAGMSDYMAKPIDESLLHRMMTRWIRRVSIECEPQEATIGDQPSEKIALLDVHRALKRLGGRESLYIEALRHFRGEFGTSHEAIVENLEAGNNDIASRLAHTVKGTSAAVGADNLSKVAADLENKILDRDPGVQDLLPAFNTTLQQTLTAIDEHLSTVVKS